MKLLKMMIVPTYAYKTVCPDPKLKKSPAREKVQHGAQIKTDNHCPGFSW